MGFTGPNLNVLSVEDGKIPTSEKHLVYYICCALQVCPKNPDIIIVLLVGGQRGQSRAWQCLLKLPPISTNGLVHYNCNAPHSQPIAIHLLKLAAISTTSSFWLNLGQTTVAISPLLIHMINMTPI